MSRQAIMLLAGRLPREEGEKLKPYDDATAKAVVAPVGNLTWGRGYNLMTCGSPGLFDAMDAYLLGELDRQLSAFKWYTDLDNEPTRQSVFLDIAYNAGVHGLLHFPSMIAQAVARNWTACAAECKVANANLDASRYAPLRQLLINGDSHT
jgi:lysozyme